MVLYLLHESALGFGVFERIESDEIGVGLPAIQKSIQDLARFGKMVKLKAFLPFTSAESALESINAVSVGEITKTLAEWLEATVPSSSKNSLGVADPKVGNAISSTLGIKCECNDMVLELLRGIRMHFEKFLKGVSTAEIHQAQLGLCHSYSRSVVKFNVHRVDAMIIQSNSLLDQLDKDVNTQVMRAREWYGKHYPEMLRIVEDNELFCKIALIIGDRKNITKESVQDEIRYLIDDSDLADRVIEGAKMSMGTPLMEADHFVISAHLKRVVDLLNFRNNLSQYVSNKMKAIAPNLAALVGDHVGARLLSHAGSITNLAKAPASTVQIYGAEKSLFRALKTKGKTPKYGLIYNSSFIARAGPKHKGRIARYLSNKISIASRVDAFSDDLTAEAPFGRELRQQVEERLEFYKTGAPPRKNIDVMRKVIAEIESHQSESAHPEEETKTDKKDKKEKKEKKEKLPEPIEDDMMDVPVAKTEKKDKKDKKEKKEKKEIVDDDEDVSSLFGKRSKSSTEEKSHKKIRA